VRLDAAAAEGAEGPSRQPHPAAFSAVRHSVFIPIVETAAFFAGGGGLIRPSHGTALGAEHLAAKRDPGGTQLED